MFFQNSQFVPMLLRASTPEELQQFFDGEIPKPGDHVVLVCYARTEKSVSLKWRVVDGPAIRVGTKQAQAEDK